MPTFEPERDLADLRALYAAIDELLALGPETLQALAAARSGWTSEQHVAHVALANELVLKNVKSLIAERGALIVRGGDPHPSALAVLAAGTLPRGQAQSPRMVRPPERVERELLAQWLADSRAALESLDAASIVAGELKIPHQLLGPLDAPQWTRFAVVHTRHHLAIVREVLEDVLGSGTRPSP